MDILDKVSVSLRCPRCGGRDEVPFKNIRAAHEELHAGCPVEMTQDCPQLFWSSLAAKELDTLERAWEQLEARVHSEDGLLVIHGISQGVPDDSAQARL